MTWLLLLSKKMRSLQLTTVGSLLAVFVCLPQAFADDSIPLLIQEGLSTEEQARYLTFECRFQLGYLDCFPLGDGQARGAEVADAIRDADRSNRTRDLSRRAATAGIPVIAVDSFLELSGYVPISFLFAERFSVANRNVTLYDFDGAREFRIGIDSLDPRTRLGKILSEGEPGNFAQRQFLEALR